MYVLSTFTRMMDLLIGWPLIFYVLPISIICTIATRFIQVRYFVAAWRYTLFPAKIEKHNASDMSPVQAFINTLNISIGNGSVAGMATAIYSGGPGAAFWVVAISVLLMSVRFAEVYLSTYFGAKVQKGTVLGGPMLYLRQVVAGRALAIIYAVCCCAFGLLVGNAVQANSIGLSVQTTFGIPALVSALVMLAFIVYVLTGGASRIVSLSQRIVPIKVFVFFVSAVALLIYHYQSLIPALSLIMRSAFSPLALSGGILGFSVQQAMRYGISRSILATESGLGTAAILFGKTGSTGPVRDAIMSMLGTFVSMLVCFMISLVIVASGVWHNGLTSTALTISAYETLFGAAGGLLVTFLSISFGIGVMVSYAYITQAAWRTLITDPRGLFFMIAYSLFTFMGPLIDVSLLWSWCDLATVSMLLINLFGIMYLLPRIRTGIASFERAGTNE